MKKTSLTTLFLLFIVILSFAQPKPKKTYDHTKFATKFHNYYSTSFSNVVDFLPTDKDLEYISSKTGKAIVDLKNDREEIKSRLQKELAHLAEKGTQGKMLQKVDLEIIQEAPIKIANIILFIHTQSTNGVVEEILFNCIQTDETWVLGNFIGFRGETPVKVVAVKEPTAEENLTKILSNKTIDLKKATNIGWDTYEIYKKDNTVVTYFAGAQIDKNSLKNVYFKLGDDNTIRGAISQKGDIVKDLTGKWTYDDAGRQLTITTKDGTVGYTVCGNTDKEFIIKEKDSDVYYVLWNTNKQVTDNTVKSDTPIGKKVKPYKATLFVQNGMDQASRYYKFDQIGMPLKGFYITNQGVKKEAVIAYVEPEKLLGDIGHAFDLVICKEANSKKVDYLNPNTEPNFKEFVHKKDIAFFYVGDQLFFQSSPGNWQILISEGIIREYVNLVKLVNNGKVTYNVTNWYQKQGGTLESSSSLMLGFKNKMSVLVADNEEMVTKIKNKEKGYTLMTSANLITEYNAWFEAKNPSGVIYMFYDDWTIANKSK